MIADANTILAPTLAPHGTPAPVTPDQIRLAAKTALAQIDPALPKLPKDSPLALIDGDLHRRVPQAALRHPRKMEGLTLAFLRRRLRPAG